MVAEQESSDVFYRRGNYYYEKGEFEKSIDQYSKAIELAAKDDLSIYKYYYNRGLAKACLERYDEAIIDLRKALDLESDFAEGHYVLGLCYEYIQNPKIAIEQYRKAVELDPDFKDAQNRIELCESKKTRTVDLQSSKPAHKDHSETFNRIRTLDELGNYSEALVTLEESLKKDPDNFQLLMSRRIIFEKNRAGKCEVVFGLEELQDTFDRLVLCPLIHASRPLYQAPIVQSSKGMIIYGPPGCGKNLFVRAMAKKAGITLIEVVLSEVLSMWAGESEKRLTAIFNNAIELAKAGKPVILFIDEVDALGFVRSLTPESGEATWSRDFRATFLRLFNEIEGIPNLIMIGATNCFWSLDDALKRPGRLGGSIMYVPPPNEKTRESMLRYFSKDTPGHEDVAYERLAMETSFFSGDDLRNICKDVHLEISRQIVKLGRTDAKAKTEDYEWYVCSRMPQVLSWMRKVEKALAEGKIDAFEVDPQLLNDVKLAESLDGKFMLLEEK